MALDFNAFSAGFQTEGPPAGGGLSSLLQNRLFLSYLSKTGAALNPQAGGIDALTQQLIGAANAKDLQDRNRRELRALLSGKGVTESISDPGSPLQKVTQTKDKTLLELADLGVEGGSSEGGQSIAGGGAERAVLKQLKEENSNFGGILSNPSSDQSGSSYSELAGLSAEDISRISRDVIATETGIAGIKYRQALGEQARAQTRALTPSVTIPGTDIQLTRSEYLSWYKTATKDDRTAAVKNFEYAVEKGFEGSFEQFQDTSRTSQQKNFEAAQADGYEGTFNEWMLEMRKAGATNIDLRGQLETRADVKRQSRVKSPDFSQDVLEDLQKDKRAWRVTAEAEAMSKREAITFDEARTVIQKSKQINEMGKRIRQVYGAENVEVRPDGWYDRRTGELIVRKP